MKESVNVAGKTVKRVVDNATCYQITPVPNYRHLYRGTIRHNGLTLVVEGVQRFDLTKGSAPLGPIEWRTV